MFRNGLIACAIAAMLTAGIGYAKVHVFVGVAPPPPVVVTPPPAPGRGYVWVPGYYTWNGANYVWANGTWVVPPHHYRHYVAGVWVHGHHGYFYRPGHWRR